MSLTFGIPKPASTNQHHLNQYPLNPITQNLSYKMHISEVIPSATSRNYFTIVPVRPQRVFLKNKTSGLPSCGALSS